MQLSVILPCFNGAETIAVQLDALTLQEWPEGWEVIVVNNGSTDASMDIVEQYRDRLPGLKIVQAHTPGTTRLGVPHSYNSGIQAASGDAFVFCEADDEVAPGWLRAMGDALAKHAFVNARLDHRKLNPPWLHPIDGEGYQSAGIFRITCHPYLLTATGCAFGLQRALYEKLGPLSIDFPMVHDAEYCFRAQVAGCALHFEPDALIYYREKPEHRSRFRQGKNWGRDFTRLVEHYGAPTPRFARTRQLIALGRCLPLGLYAWAMQASGEPAGRKRMAEWFWNLGWFCGVLEARREPIRSLASHLPLVQEAPAGPSGSGMAL